MSSVKILRVEGEATTSPLALKRLVETREEITVWYEYNGVLTRVTVPVRYSTNGASIPWFLWPIFGTPYSPKNILAAILHDYVYEFEKRDGYSVEEMSDLFRGLLLKAGVGKVRSSLMRQGVYVYTSLIKYKR